MLFGVVLCYLKYIQVVFLRTKGPVPLPCVVIHNINITYQFSLLLFVCLACPWPALLRTLARHHLAARLLAYQHLLGPLAAKSVTFYGVNCF